MAVLLDPTREGTIHIRNFRAGWQVHLTTEEDLQAAQELGLGDKVEVDLQEAEARQVLNRINDRASQIRNPELAKG